MTAILEKLKLDLGYDYMKLTKVIAKKPATFILSKAGTLSRWPSSQMSTAISKIWKLSKR